MVKEILIKLSAGKNLDFQESERFMDAVADGEVTDSQISAFLTALRVKGETSAEIAGCVSSLRKHAVRVPHNQEIVFDCCGTGGDGSNTFNISTAAALVVAACGVPTAKHGNRAVSSACGSADVLEEAGANIEISPEQSAALLDEIGFCFLYAPLYHPATRRVGAVRRELGFRTVFNLLGPLLNPAGATHQIVGTSSIENGRKLAAVAQYVSDLNLTCFHNSNGIDEIIPHGSNYFYKWSAEGLCEGVLSLPPFLQDGVTAESIQGGDKRTNLNIMIEVLSGADTVHTKVTATNAALGLLCAGKAVHMDEGYYLALEAMQSKAAFHLLKRFVELSQKVW